jgi:hypothetical protein
VMARIALLLLFFMLTGCAMFNRNNTRALNFVEAHLVPSDPLSKKLSYPVTIPVSLAAVIFDMVLLHPISVIPDAARDSRDLWQDLPWREQYFTTSASVLPRAAFTPIFFTGDFLGRSLFDVSEKQLRPDPEKEKEQHRVDEAKRALRENRLSDALVLAQQVLKKSPHQQEAQRVRVEVLLKQGSIAELTGKPFSMKWSEALEQDFIHALSVASSENRIRLLSLYQWFYPATSNPELLTAMVATLRDDDRAIRMKALQVLGNRLNDPTVRAAIQEIAQQPDPVLATEANMILGK